MEWELEEAAREFLNELLNDPKFLESARKTKAISAAEKAAREAAGLGEGQGTITFVYPNCGCECVSSRVKVRGFSWLHGGFSCEKCDIRIWS